MGGHYASVFMSVVSFGFTRAAMVFIVVFEWGLRRRYVGVYVGVYVGIFLDFSRGREQVVLGVFVGAGC